MADVFTTSGTYKNICIYLLIILNINYFLQVKLLRFAKKRGCHVCVLQDEGNATVIAEALESKKNEDSHEDTK